MCTAVCTPLKWLLSQLSLCIIIVPFWHKPRTSNILFVIQPYYSSTEVCAMVGNFYDLQEFVSTYNTLLFVTDLNYKVRHISTLSINQAN